MDFLHFIKTVLGILPFVALCLASAKTNLNKANRSRQFLMPIVALIYCIVGVALLDTINNWIFKLFNWLGQYLTFLQNISWQSIATFVLNAVLVLGFIVVKGITISVIFSIFLAPPISTGVSKIISITAPITG